jgi:hypothetical protein
MRYLVYFIPPLWLSLFVGWNCTSGSSYKANSSNTDSLHQRVRAGTNQPTTIKANNMLIDAIVESVSTVSGYNYHLYIRLITSTPSEGMEGIAAGQHMVIAPQYAIDEKGIIDTANQRNQKLRRLVFSKPGDVFTGSVTLTSQGEWILRDVHSP